MKEYKIIYVEGDSCYDAIVVGTSYRGCLNDRVKIITKIMKYLDKLDVKILFDLSLSVGYNASNRFIEFSFHNQKDFFKIVAKDKLSKLLLTALNTYYRDNFGKLMERSVLTHQAKQCFWEEVSSIEYIPFKTAGAGSEGYTTISAGGW